MTGCSEKRRIENNMHVQRESDRKKMVDKKIAALNLSIKRDSEVPVIQGTQGLYSNPRVMRQDLLEQEEGVECSKGRRQIKET